MSGQSLTIIPARFASTRFPGKPLADIAGKSMIRRVYENVLAAGCLGDIIVATDDDRIFRHVESFGGKVVMTASHHKNGTERCAEVLEKLLQAPPVVLCIQGDEPFIAGEHIKLLLSVFDNQDTRIATLVKSITNPEELTNPNIPKVVMNMNNEALYFSRSSIPFLRSFPLNTLPDGYCFYKHIGIYGYRSETLKDLVRLPETNLEKAEQLEQLRWLENGYRIKLVKTFRENFAVDTPEDLRKLLNLLKEEGWPGSATETSFP